MKLQLGDLDDLSMLQIGSVHLLCSRTAGWATAKQRCVTASPSKQRHQTRAEELRAHELPGHQLVPGRWVDVDASRPSWTWSP